MITQSLFKRLLSSSLIWMITITCLHASEVKNFELYTTNTKISIPPGESINYTIDVKNLSNETRSCNLSVTGIPTEWTSSLKSDSYSIKQITLHPGTVKKISLRIKVPLKVNKGNYKLTVHAEDALLPLIINISKQGTYKSEFTTSQANMEGHAKSKFTFQTNLKNETDETQLYSLKSKSPKGWQVNFKPNRKQATSVEIDPNDDANITVEITPPQNALEGTYKIPIKAINKQSSSDLELEVVITGTYELDLTSPGGLVSTKITAGGERKLELIVKNTGSVNLNNIKMKASKPIGWQTTFSPSTIESLEPGQKTMISVTLNADKKAIAGDYVTHFSAYVPETTSQIDFRVLVKTPALWGWIGILIILTALGVIIFLFRKYGRR